MKKLSDTIAEVMKPLDTLRAQIGANRQRHEELKRAPLTKEEAQAAFRAWLNYQADLGQSHLRDVIGLFAHPGARPELFPPEMTPAEVARTAGHVFVALNRVALETLATDCLADAPTGELSRASISDDMRKLDAELLKLEVREEKFVRELEAQGLPVSRRGAASPAIVLSELED